MEQGQYSKISNKQYHAESHYLSRSQLFDLLKSPRFFYEKYILKNIIEKDSNNLLLGSLFHTLVLEPENFDNEYVKIDKLRRSLKSEREIYDNELKKNSDKIWITDSICKKTKKISCSDYEKILEMVGTLKLHPFFKIIERGGNVENSFFWNENVDGKIVSLKTRPDFYNDDVIVDIKTSNSCLREDFKHSIIKYGYHLQAAMMIDGIESVTGKKHKNFIFFVIEKNKPYLSQAFRVEDEVIEYGRHQYKKAIRTYLNLMEKNKWPIDFPDNDGLTLTDNSLSIVSVNLPNYLSQCNGEL